MKVNDPSPTQPTQPSAEPANAAEGQLHGMSVVTEAAPHGPAKDRASGGRGVFGFFKSLSSRLSQPAHLASESAAPHRKSLPALPVSLLNGITTLAEASQHAVLAERIAKLGQAHGGSVARAGDFIEMSLQARDLKSGQSVCNFIDAIRAEFLTDDPSRWLDTGGEHELQNRATEQLDAALNDLKEKALDPHAQVEDLKEELAAVLAPLRQNQLNLLEEKLGAEFLAQFK